MKLILKLMAICFLPFLYSTSTNAQWIYTNLPTIYSAINDKVGIGNYFVVPNNAVSLLDVDGGDINTGRTGATDQYGYQIGHTYVLWHNGNASDIFVGVASGSLNSGGNNTFVGNLSGNSLNGGSDNVAIGAGALRLITNAYQNVAIGSGAGANQIDQFSNVYVGYNAGHIDTSYDNSFVGYNAGAFNVTGGHNCFFGDEAGYSNSIDSCNVYIGAHCADYANGSYNVAMGYESGKVMASSYNTFIGDSSGVLTDVGDHNTFIGRKTGNTNTDGIYNTVLGAGADVSTHGLVNATAIGAGAIVPTDYQLILGSWDNNNGYVNVGIGLSGDNSGTPGPQRPLEINADPNSYQYSGIDKSGLRFRQLTSASDTEVWNGKVLSVNSSGDVILVKDSLGTGGGGGITNTCFTGNMLPKVDPANSANLICSQIFDSVYVGIATTLPQSLLHQHAVGTNNPSWHQFTNSNTGNGSSTVGFATGIRFDGGTGSTWAELRQYQQAPMSFYTRANATSPNNTLRERIRITDGLGGDNNGNWTNTSGVTKVSITHDGVMPPEVAMLNIGANAGSSIGTGGKRDWMDVGTYYHWDSDNMYSGLIDMGSNRKDAVIDFGDDAQLPPGTAYETLHFNFTTCCGSGTDPYDAGNPYGLEIARMTGTGTMGIGPTFTNSIAPKARLDIFDDQITSWTVSGNTYYSPLPQLRLSSVLSSSSAGGSWTDFTTTDTVGNTGNLYIHPNGGAAWGRVGINEKVPGNTLEINSHNSLSNNGNGSGLKFTNMNNTVTPQTNPTNGVLSVDASGNVILVDDKYGTSSGPVAACTSGVIANYITKWTGTGNEICKSIAYESGSSIGIGWGTSLPSSRTLEVYGAVNVPLIFSSRPNGYYIGNNKVLSIPNSGTSVCVGYQAGDSSSVPNYCTLIGNTAGNKLTGNYNTLVGDRVAPTATSSTNNTAVGAAAGNFLTTGSSNVFVGSQAGVNDSTGDYNVFVGYSAGTHNGTKSKITCVGFGANVTTGDSEVVALGNITSNCSDCMVLKPSKVGINTNNPHYSMDIVGDISIPASLSGNVNGYKIGGDNILSICNSGKTTCVGLNACSSMTTSTPTNCTIMGFDAGQILTSGANYNTFFGIYTGDATTSGSNNTAIGPAAGRSITTGTQNTSIGDNAGSNGYVTTGINNTFIGAYADANVNDSNSCAIGYGTTTTATNKMWFGSPAVIGCYNTSGLWTSSDGRFKINVNENVSGLDFINRLRPVTYNLDTRALDEFINSNRQLVDNDGNPISLGLDFTPSTNMIRSGFIAQEVEQAANESNFHSSIISAPANEHDPYALNYAEMVVPLVKAVQQLSQQVQDLQAQVNSHQVAPSQNNEEENRTAIDVTLSSKTIVLDQNQPNPFAEQTTITYFIPENTKNVKIIFTDNKGNVLKEVDVRDTGRGQLNVYAQDLTSGIYTYTLVADGVTIDSKKMVCNK